MSGTVGASEIRSDVRQQIVDNTPRPTTSSIVEGGLQIRHAEVGQPDFRSRTTASKTLMEVYGLFKQTLEFATTVDGTNYPIRFTLEFPPDAGQLPCFSTRLISRVPFEFNGRKEIAPRFIEGYDDPDYPGEIIEEFMHRHTNIIEVTSWAKTNKVANDYADWLESKFWEFIWVLQWGGLAHPVHFIARGEDKYEQPNDQQMYGCPTTFQVVTGKITKKRVTALRKLAYSMGLSVAE